MRKIDQKASSRSIKFRYRNDHPFRRIRLHITASELDLSSEMIHKILIKALKSFKISINDIEEVILDGSCNRVASYAEFFFGSQSIPFKNYIADKRLPVKKRHERACLDLASNMSHIIVILEKGNPKQEDLLRVAKKWGTNLVEVIVPTTSF